MCKDHLKKLIRQLSVIVILGSGFSGLCKFYGKILERERKRIEKNRVILKMFSRWLQNRESGKTIESYLKEMGFQTIAIYGMSDAGQRLYEELRGSSINIEYAIDKRMIEMENDIKVVSLDKVSCKADVIIVTAVYDFPEIAEILRQKTQSQIISLEQIIYEL